MHEIAWEARMIGIKGARGVGKTTLLLQYIKKHLPLNEETLYLSLDNIWFAENSLLDLVDEFVKKGGKYLFLDEVHKYPNWAQELKNMYDDYPELKVVFTGSSMLEILNARADLSRRAVVYHLQGLSYREFLNLTLKQDFKTYSMEEVLTRHVDIAQEINALVRPLQHFETYLQSGYYPFFQEVGSMYYPRIEEVVNMILEIELPLLRKVEVAYITKLKQLLHIIAQSVPFVPNVSKLSERMGINRNTLLTYLYFLQEAQIIKSVYKNAKGITQLQKPDKIFLENTNLQKALSGTHFEIGSVRETFFVNQVAYRHVVEYTEPGDFKVEGVYTFEIGGYKKTGSQLESVANAYVAADDIEYGHGNRVPLWMFGFFY
jgi:predicted AAA+ superfamily ATPase